MFEEARSKECRRKAMLEEMASIEQNNTWYLADLPSGHHPIGLKWVFKVKRNKNGSIAKHKAHLIAKGYVQQQGIDFEEVFALVARVESVRMLLAVAVQQGWLVHHMDVKFMFLNGELDEEVYVHQPPGFIPAGHEGKVLRLRKVLYGLLQVPRAWNVKLDSSLRDLGFTRCANEHGLYTRGEEASRVVVGVYVNDLIITGASAKEIGAFKDEMRCLFRMSDLGLLSFYLGIKVKQIKGTVTLCQAAYRVRKEAAGEGRSRGLQPLPDANGATPHAVQEQRHTEGQHDTVPQLGGQPVLLGSHPVGLRVCHWVREQVHGAAAAGASGGVKHMLCYVSGTIDYGIIYSKHGDGELYLNGYSDGDLGEDVDDRKSTTGIIFFLGDMP